jgi:hypothetical protein
VNSVNLVPDVLVGRVEQVCAVPVHLDAGLRFHLAVCVATDVRTSVDDQHLETQLVGCPFGDRQAEETRTDNEQIYRHINTFTNGNHEQ